MGDSAACEVRHRAEVTKAWRFPREVLRLGDLLDRAAGPHERAMVAAARRLLGVDWGRASGGERTRRLAEVLAVLRGLGKRIPTAAQPVLDESGRSTVRAARERARDEHGLPVALDFNMTDQRTVARLPRMHALFVRDELGRRVDAFGERARTIVARGLEQGLGRDDVARDLGAAANGLRPRAYWDVVAGSFMGTARSLGELSAYADAGVRRYQLVAVMDEHTCLPAGTRVRTRTGPIAIERVKPGDEVLTHLGRWRPVGSTHHHDGARALLRVRTAGGATVPCTGNHAFLTRRGRRWIWLRADRLAVGDVVLRDEGRDGVGFPLERRRDDEAIASLVNEGVFVEDVVTWIADGGVVDTVFDLTVEDDASFVAEGIVVHNSDICRFLDGKTFAVGEALRTWDRVSARPDPFAIKEGLPWCRVSANSRGAREIWVRRGDERVVLASVDRSGEGKRDERGEYVQRRGDAELADLGVGLPPFHGHCRTSVSPLL